MKLIKTGNIYDKDNSMNLLNLTEKEIAQLIESLAKNPEIKEDEKSPTLNWLREQLSEQKIGGAWKRRLRDKGWLTELDIRNSYNDCNFICIRTNG